MLQPAACDHTWPPSIVLAWVNADRSHEGVELTHLLRGHANRSKLVQALLLLLPAALCQVHLPSALLSFGI